ncbi:hypothetical protein IFM89_023088 [Coptis chinensis]|uniref:Endonuclease/exonuclease/phosphatase domain-containing protein n=1 Tax=Coptis chinensis TaxID=261450 RepID=A0A835HSB2_9MAGN|nr:hypothetical protein IFM89_023088 [Coptis chinensis]
MAAATVKNPSDQIQIKVSDWKKGELIKVSFTISHNKTSIFSMRCIFWNIRGIANDKTQNRLSKLINKWDPDIVGIAEPMINPGDISRAYLQSLGMSASFYSNDRQNSVPNIWLLWKSTVSTPTLLQQSSQQITVEGWNYKVGSRICSDHSPIMGCGVNVPRPGNMPFKFFNIWCTDPNFRDIVKASWEIPIWGHSIFILTQKLKRLKATLKKWNKELFGNITSKVEMESKNLERMQNQFETETVPEEFIEMMVEQEKKVELLLQQEQMFWRQKSKTQWDNDNDRSTKFFHVMVNRNKSKSLIS